jgi:LacI family transcriptional regulator
LPIFTAQGAAYAICPMNVTMKDIGKELGVSIGTVSKVVRDHPDIGPETRDRIRKRMQQLNYRPNLTARALVTGRTHTIGLVVPDLTPPFFAEVARGLSRVLNAKGYSLIISSSEEDTALELREIDRLLARRVDALLLASSRSSSESFGQIRKQKTPIVLIDRRPESPKSNFVGVNDREIGRMATEHLLSMGCRRVAYIGGRAISTAVGRLRGYEEALLRHGLKVDPKYATGREHVDADSDVTGYDAMKTPLALDPPPDGVFCYNHPIAVGAMQAALEWGFGIPKDIALVGAGNVRYARFLRIPLTNHRSAERADGRVSRANGAQTD